MIISSGLVKRVFLVLVALFVAAGACDAKTLTFAGHTWTVRPDGDGGPGPRRHPNHWSENNAWVDPHGELHLRITKSDGKWYCAEVYSNEAFGFGQYQWHVISRVDKLDRNVVFGLFSYLCRDTDSLNEIDIEMGRWGNAFARNGNFTVWPSTSSWIMGRTTRTFPVSLPGDYTTCRFNWQSSSVYFQLLSGHRTDNDSELYEWRFSPIFPSQQIPQAPMPVHMNLWLFKGAAPSDGREVEVIIKGFRYRK